MKLLEFSYSIEYKKGRESTTADALSRKNQSLHVISLATPTWVTDIENSYTNDTHYTSIIQELVINVQAMQHYLVHSGILRYKGRICVGDDTKLRNKILSSLHTFAIGGTQG
jgi:hypothetical protein